MVLFALVLSTIAQASCITYSAEQNTERAVKLAEGDDLQFTVQVVQLDDVDANRYSEVFVSFRLLHSGEVFRTGTHKGTSPWAGRTHWLLRRALTDLHASVRILSRAQNGRTSSTTSSR